MIPSAVLTSFSKIKRLVATDSIPLNNYIPRIVAVIIIPSTIHANLLLAGKDAEALDKGVIAGS
jgi:hypothetical protein